MKKYTLLISGLLSIGLCQSQVGINTMNPQGILHIDPLSNTSGVNNALDDVVVTTSGVGLGTTMPSTRLHIKTSGVKIPGVKDTPIPGFRLEDGNEGLTKALVSDATGLATWKDMVLTESIIGVNGSGVNVPLTTTGIFLNTNSYILLPPGRWLVNVVMYVRTPSALAYSLPDGLCWVNSTFAEYNTLGGTDLATTKSGDIEGGALVSGLMWQRYQGGILYGSIVVYNRTASAKQYYYMIGDITDYGDPTGNTNPNAYIVTAGGPWGEDNIVAFRLPDDL